MVGGLVGSFDGTITQAYATGAVTGVANVGGLVGLASGGTISASFWNTQTTGRAHAVGSGAIPDGAFGRTTAVMQDINTFRATYAGPGFAWDFDTVWAPPNQVGQNNGAATAFYPQLYSVSTVAAVFVPDASRIYGDANPTFGPPSYRGLRPGDTIGTAATIGTTAIATSNVGAHPLTPSGTTVISPQGWTYRIVHVPGTLTITPRPITLVGSRAYDGTTAIAGSELSVANLVGTDTLTLTGTGSVASPNVAAGTQALNFGSLALSGASAGNYTLAGGNGTVVITPRPVALAGSRAYDGTTAIAGGVLSVTNLVGSDTLTLIGTGSVASANVAAGAQALNFGSLALSGASAANYTLAGGTGTVVITPRPLTVTADPQSRVYGDANPALTFQLGGLGLIPGETLTGALATTATPTSHVGPHAITQGSLANSNYAITFIGNDLTITPRPVTLTGSRVYDGTTVIAGGVLSVTNLVGTDTLSLTGTGSVASPNVAAGAQALSFGSLALSGTSAANYTLTGASGTATITPRSLTVTAEPLSRVYGDANPTLTFQIGGLGLVPGDTLTGALATSATPTSNVGPHAITQGSLAANPNYAITFIGNDLTITPRPVTLTGSRVYDGTTAVAGAVLSVTNLVGTDTLSLTGTGAVASPNASVTPQVLSFGSLALSGASAANYTLAGGTGTATVTPRPLTVTADPQSRVYGDANPALTFQLGGLGLVPGETLTGALATAATPTSNVGPHAITQGSLAASPNYAITFIGNDLTITPRPVTLTGNRVYDGTTAIAGSVLSITNLVGTDTLSLTGTSSVASPNASATPQALSFGSLALSGASAANYTLAGGTGTATVTPRPLTVTAEPLSRVYGDANPTLTFQIGGLGLVPGDTLTGALATSATPTSNVGPHPITQGTLAASPNYAITFIGNDLTITPRPVTLTGSRVYDGTTAVAGAVLSVTNLVGTDTLSLTGTSSVASPNASATPQALSFGSLALSGASAANYTLAGGTGTVVITPRPLTVAADPLSRVYGEANPALTFQISGLGLIPGDTLTGALATTATPTTNVGPHPITQGTLAANTNYAITFFGNDLTITPATLLLTADDARRPQGQPNPPFSFSVTGLVAGDGRSVISGIELISPATAQSPPGLYPITLIGGLAANYTLIRLPGVLTVLATRPEVIPNLNISTSNIPPPQVQLPTTAETDPPVDPQLTTGSVTTMPLQQAAGGGCGAEIEAGILGCASGFPAVLN